MNKLITIFAAFLSGFGLILLEQSNFVERQTPLASFVSSPLQFLCFNSQKA